MQHYLSEFEHLVDVMKGHRLIAFVSSRRPVIGRDCHAVQVANFVLQHAVDGGLHVVVEPRADSLSQGGRALDVGLGLEELNKAGKEERPLEK